MILQSIKPALREFTKRDIFKWLNIIGLAVGITSAILISAYINSELQIGKSQADHEELFLLKSSNGATHSAIVLETLKNQLPEFNTATAFHGQWGKGFLINGENKHKVTDLFFGDSHFFEVFKYNVIYGDLDNAFKTSNGCVLTQDMALKIFGDKNPVGETLMLQQGVFGKSNIVVNAVIETPNSSAFIKIGGCLNKKILKTNDWYKKAQTHWGNQNQFIFAKLPENTNKEQLASKVTKVVEDNAPKWFIEDSREYSLINIADLHFSNIDFWGLFKTNKKSRLVTLGVIGIFLLIIGWINFINLATARHEKLVTLFQIKKNLGASSRHLLVSNFFELIPTILLSMMLAGLLVTVLYKPFNYFSEVSMELADFFTSKVLIIALVFFVITLLVCSSLPQWFIQKKATTNSKLRASLSVFQFAVSIVLIIATLFIVKQNSYMKNKSAGFSNENILTVALKGKIKEKAKMFGEKLLSYSSVKEITYASSLLSNVQQDWGMSLSVKGENKRISYSAIQVDKSFFQFFDIPLIQGNGFTEISAKEQHHIFNETALKTFGIDDISSSRIRSYGSASGDIIGVVKDFNFRSFHTPITPLGFIEQKPEGLDYLYVKLNVVTADAISNCINDIKKDWIEIETEWPAEVKFLSQSTQELYDAETKFSELILIVAAISILISCLGLLGVCKFVAEKRTKEIGIRKVNGARISEILAMLNKDFIKWVFLAFVLACPIAWFAINKWLENFAYKTTLSWWVFVVAGVTAMCIAIFTVSWQSWRAATRNPVEALRYE